jgi:hypothetical protein
MILFHTLPQQIWMICMLAVIALTFWRGGWAERTIAIGMIVDTVASAVMQNTRDWASPQWADLTIDVIYLLVMLFVAFRSHRLWPLWAAAFQLIDVAIYFAFIVDRRVGALAPYRAIVIWSYLILIVIVVGTLTRRSRPVSRSVM